ncbi:hypothetical protein R7035_07640 [Vibrio sp. 1731]|nr:hypothetical protein [Vibrio sp. 1731]
MLSARFYKTISNEFYQVTLRNKLYCSMEELQKDLDEWMEQYKSNRKKGTAVEHL